LLECISIDFPAGFRELIPGALPFSMLSVLRPLRYPILWVIDAMFLSNLNSIIPGIHLFYGSLKLVAFSRRESTAQVAQ
jgi:hypothetical protein